MLFSALVVETGLKEELASCYLESTNLNMYIRLKMSECYVWSIQYSGMVPKHGV